MPVNQRQMRVDEYAFGIRHDLTSAISLSMQNTKRVFCPPQSKLTFIYPLKPFPFANYSFQESYILYNPKTDRQVQLHATHLQQKS